MYGWIGCDLRNLNLLIQEPMEVRLTTREKKKKNLEHDFRADEFRQTNKSRGWLVGGGDCLGRYMRGPCSGYCAWRYVGGLRGGQ